MSWKQPLEEEAFGVIVWLGLFVGLFVQTFVVVRAALDWVGKRVNA